MKYRVWLETVASTVIEVEAEDEEQAKDLAYEEGMPSLCAQCSGWGQDQNLELGDAWDVVVVEAGGDHE